MFDDRTRHLTNLASDAYAAAAKSGPPVAVTALSVAGVGLQDWVLIVTLVYVVLQSAYLLWKWARDLRTKTGANG